MIKIAICDDENSITGQIENLIYDICHENGIAVDIDVYNSGADLEKKITAGIYYDLLYLDIQMNNGDGITTAGKIRELDENVVIIFVSGYEKYMIELFRLDVFAFIKKPIEEKTFIQTFLEANGKISKKNFYFSYRYKNEEFKIPCKDIVYFESKGRQINIHTRNGEIELFNGKLSDVEMKLEEGKVPFLRIHQSFLVNYHQVKSRTKSEITLVNGVKLPISDERQKKISEEYGKLLGDEINV